jgi:hypothetical protein
MSYKSSRPTKARKMFYNFLEGHKERNKMTNRKDFTVDARKVGNFIKRKKFVIHKAPKFSGGGKHYLITTKRGSRVGDVVVNKKRKINWWIVE